MRRQLIIGTFISLALGLAGGYVCVRIGAPFILGFLTGFVLAGLITLFVLAVTLENARHGR